MEDTICLKASRQVFAIGVSLEGVVIVGVDVWKPTVHASLVCHCVLAIWMQDVEGQDLAWCSVWAYHLLGQLIDILFDTTA